jgi:hypothetical protein
MNYPVIIKLVDQGTKVLHEANSYEEYSAIISSYKLSGLMSEVHVYEFTEVFTIT